MSEELARRAVACKGWRWMPGMLTDHGRVCGDRGFLVFDGIDESETEYVDCTDTIADWPDALPDLTDPATLGCLLALVREAWADPLGACFPMEQAGSGAIGWGYVSFAGVGIGDFSQSEAGALVSALWKKGHKHECLDDALGCWECQAKSEIIRGVRRG